MTMKNSGSSSFPTVPSSHCGLSSLGRQQIPVTILRLLRPTSDWTGDSKARVHSESSPEAGGAVADVPELRLRLLQD